MTRGWLMCSSAMWGSNWSSHSTLLPCPQSTSPLPLSVSARRRARYAHCHCCHLHSADDVVYFTTPQQRRMWESRVVLMGQMYSDEDKRGLFSFPSKAGNGKSVPRRNHVLPGVEGLCRVGGSCQALIRDSYSHLRICVHTILPVCLCVRVCLHVLETVRAFAHYKVTYSRGPLQHDMLMTGRRRAHCSHPSHNTGIISSICIIISISAQAHVITALPFSVPVSRSSFRAQIMSRAKVNTFALKVYTVFKTRGRSITARVLNM